MIKETQSDTPADNPVEKSPEPEQAAAQETSKNEAPVAPPVVSLEDLEKQAREFGRVDESGTVWVRDTEGERQVGQFPEQVPADPLELYVRRFLDIAAQVDLFAVRLPNLGNRDIDQTLSSLRKSVKSPSAVGDLEYLRKRVEYLRHAAKERKEQVREERAALRAQALSDREKLVAQAEEIAAQDPARTQWKQSGQQLRDLLEEWKQAQRRGPRLDRSVEDKLWKRFSSARTQFDRRRRQFFSQLDASQAEAKRLKQKLVIEAQKLSSSTEWGPTHQAFLRLMDEWKAAGRASRKDDDMLWEQFNTARQVFYDARRAKTDAVESEQKENLAKKEELVVQAEALLPIKDLAAVKAALRPIQDAWDEIGFVPISQRDRIEGRLRAVERAVHEAEEAEWQRSNPETKARAEGLLGQLEESIAELEDELSKAREQGDEATIKKAEEALSARKAWLEQVRSVTE